MCPHQATCPIIAGPITNVTYNCENSIIIFHFTSKYTTCMKDTVQMLLATVLDVK